MEIVAEFWTEIDKVSRRKRARRVVLTLLAAAAVSGSAACSSPGDGAEAATIGTPTTSAPVVVAADQAPQAPQDPEAPSNGSPAPAPTPTAPPTTAAPTDPAPVIDSFSTPENIDCHNGNFQEFTASWATTGAERVTIAIDGPGIYAEYGPDGETSLPFNCSTPHTFTLVAIGADGQTASRQVTLEPRNAQPEDPEAPIDDLEAAQP